MADSGGKCCFCFLPKDPGATEILEQQTSCLHVSTLKLCGNTMKDIKGLRGFPFASGVSTTRGKWQALHQQCSVELSSGSTVE